MWGALIGAGASLIGSIFGGGSKERKTTTTQVNRVDYARMVRDAEAAGFNPLTALRNGGAAGFSIGTTTSTTPPTPLSARIADGVAGGVQSFLANFDPFQDQKREMEFKLVEAQLANLQADTRLKGANLNRVRFGDVPSYAAGPMQRRMGAGVKQGQSFKSAADALPANAGASRTPTVETPTLTNPWPTSWGVEIDPNVPDAAAAEERWGDVGGALYGLGVMANDGYRAFKASPVGQAMWNYMDDNKGWVYPVLDPVFGPLGEAMGYRGKPPRLDGPEHVVRHSRKGTRKSPPLSGLRGFQ